MKSLSYRDTELPIEDRIKYLLNEMTIEEKVYQLSAAWLSEISENGVFSIDRATSRIGNGIGEITRPAGSTSMKPYEVTRMNNSIQAFLKENTRLGIPVIIHEECLSGFMARQATVFPQIIGLASTWDVDLLENIGDVIGKQISSTGAQQGLAPVLDICRDPRWGRLEETFGEDTYLVARLGSAYIKGIQQKNKVIATGKHFAGHGIAQAGLNWAPIHIGLRELREVYLFPFEAAVKYAGLGSIMNAYHEIDGVPAAASKLLLKQILREEWGFDGFVVSDYNAIIMLKDYHHIVTDKSEAARLALEAGIEIELPQTDCYGEPLKDAISTGVLKMDVVDEAVRRILRPKFRLGLFENPFTDESIAFESFKESETRLLSHLAAQESIILLKNHENLLPLRNNIRSIAVIGSSANNPRLMLGDYTYGAFAELMDGGDLPPEKTQFPDRLPQPFISILDAIKNKVTSETKVSYVKGCNIFDVDTEEFSKAIEISRNSDIAILIMGGKSGLTQDCTSGELRDRSTLGLLSAQEKMVEAVFETGTPVILIMVDGRPICNPDLVEKIPVILQAWLPGEEGGPAIADILFGNFNPCGKLPITVPRSVGQIPTYYSHKPSAGQSYNFINYVDQSVEPLFPFGHGLSFTSFAYHDLVISPGQVDGIADININFGVENTGKIAGTEIVQLYLHDQISSLTRPILELKGFDRVSLEPGETRNVTFRLSTSQLAFYDLDMEFILEPGIFEVMIGSSSKDIRLTGLFEVSGRPQKIHKKVFFSESYEF
jgi:beta-glucosidase